ncbi:CooT family nickel-binding protein [Candidatus Bathyarchaeota archaeon]|nr:CooT family nickel-binding protein [Candidatus Bathyarchaeota archaeon]
MCEFDVYLEENGSEEREVVARKIIKAKKKKDGKTVLMDASGNVTPVEHVSIVVVDTLMQELILRKERDG